MSILREVASNEPLRERQAGLNLLDGCMEPPKVFLQIGGLGGFRGVAIIGILSHCRGVEQGWK